MSKVTCHENHQRRRPHQGQDAAVQEGQGLSSAAAGRLLRTAKETLVRAGVFAFRDRRAASASSASCGSSASTPPCRERGLRYSEFIDGLDKAKIELDRKIALRDGRSTIRPAFDAVVEQVKAGRGMARD